MFRKLTLEKLRYEKRLKDAEEEFKDNFTYSDNNTELRDVISPLNLSIFYLYLSSF